MGAIVYIPVLTACIMGGGFFGQFIGKRFDAENAGTIIGSLVGFLVVFPIIGSVIKNTIFNHHRF